MHVLSYTGFFVALLSLAGAAFFIAVVMGQYANPLGDEMALCIRKSVDLLDSCAHSVDGEPLTGEVLAELGSEPSQTPVRRLPLTPSSSRAGS